MNNADLENPPELGNDPRRLFWYRVLNSFPFIFVPVVVLIGILCALIMPYLTGAHPR